MSATPIFVESNAVTAPLRRTTWNVPSAACGGGESAAMVERETANGVAAIDSNGSSSPE